MGRRARWLRITAEGAVIVASILLAFAIDAWWDRQQDREDEREALAVLVEELDSVIEQMTEFRRFAEDKSRAAIDLRAILNAPVPIERRDDVNDLMMRNLLRRTVSLPRSGYTDLVSTGAMRVISDQELRARILQVYERAERVERIIEKNTALSTDRLLMDALIGSGLWTVGPQDAELIEFIARRNALLLELMGPEYPRLPDPFWQYGPDSAEWARVRSVLSRIASDEAGHVVFSDTVIDDATALRNQLQTWLIENRN